jgi:hypothetical protein
VQIHVADSGYRHQSFSPWRVVAAFLKALRTIHPQFHLWRDFAYEYEHGRLAFDVINGGPRLRQWIEAAGASAADLDAVAARDEQTWREQRRASMIYPG